MDPVSIWLGMMAAKLMVKATDRAEEQTVDAASAALSHFASWLRHKVSGHPSATVLERLEDASDSDSRIRALAEALDERAAADPGFAAELRNHLDQARAAGVPVPPITQSATGDGNVQVADNQGSVSVTYGAQSGPAASR